LPTSALAPSLKHVLSVCFAIVVSLVAQQWIVPDLPNIYDSSMKHFFHHKPTSASETATMGGGDGYKSVVYFVNWVLHLSYITECASNFVVYFAF
jgi:hypothetical protein